VLDTLCSGDDSLRRKIVDRPPEKPEKPPEIAQAINKSRQSSSAVVFEALGLRAMFKPHRLTIFANPS
jgi:hypothetical protein